MSYQEAYGSYHAVNLDAQTTRASPVDLVLLLTDGYNSQTIAANIALNFPIATDLQRSALIGTGLMLFVVSLAVNMLARYIIGATGPGAKGRKKGKRS